jgi:hypothetical protein
MLEQALQDVEEAFAGVPRPARLNRGTCSCGECLENTAYFEAAAGRGLDIDRLGNEACDPVVVLSDEAFAYFLPSLLRVAMERPAYVDQLLFHLVMPDRANMLNAKQRTAVLRMLESFAERDESLLAAPALYRLDNALRLLEGGTA